MVPIRSCSNSKPTNSNLESNDKSFSRSARFERYLYSD